MKNLDDLGFAQGGEEELDKVIAQYRPRLFKYCYNIVCDYHAAEDITQLVFIKAYSNRRRFKGKSALSTWLYRIAYNCCVDYIRKQRFTLPLFEVKDISSMPHDLPEAEDEFSTEVLEALLLLTPKERAIVYGRIIEEKSYSELAQISNISEAVLRNRYIRGKKKLADALRSTDIMKGRLHNEES